MYFTIQLAEPAEPDRLQGPLKVPVLLVVRAKDPDGVTGAPAPAMSMTVTVQVDRVFTVTGLVQLTVVEVGRRFTTILAAALVLPE